MMNKYDLYSSTIFIFSVVTLVIFSGCTTDDDDLTYTININNQSSSIIKVYAYRFEGGPIVDSSFISNNATEPFCTYRSPSWASFGCTDSNNILEFRFENGKGYRCIEGDRGVNVSNICFQNSFDPFDPPRPINSGTISIINITEEDFENAFDIF